jgi:hypothetical protein
MRPPRRADNVTTFKCRVSRYLGASTSWNPKGLSRTVMGLLFLLYEVDHTDGLQNCTLIGVLLGVCHRSCCR